MGTVVHSSQMYKRSLWRYKQVTVSLIHSEASEPELHYGTGASEKVVPWRKVVAVHANHGTSELEIDTRDGHLHFRVDKTSVLDEWMACLPAARGRHSQVSGRAGSVTAGADADSGRDGGGLSARYGSFAAIVGIVGKGRRSRSLENAPPERTPGGLAGKRYATDKGARWVYHWNQSVIAAEAGWRSVDTTALADFPLFSRRPAV